MSTFLIFLCSIASASTKMDNTASPKQPAHWTAKQGNKSAKLIFFLFGPIHESAPLLYKYSLDPFLDIDRVTESTHIRLYRHLIDFHPEFTMESLT